MNIELVNWSDPGSRINHYRANTIRLIEEYGSFRVLVAMRVVKKDFQRRTGTWEPLDIRGLKSVFETIGIGHYSNGLTFDQADSLIGAYIVDQAAWDKAFIEWRNKST